MESEKQIEIKSQFDLICPECGVGNLKNAEKCLVCERDLKNVVAFFEDDSFDLEITKDSIFEYRKTFWGNSRTGKVNKYSLDKIENIEFGSSISRFIFNYEGKRVVLPLQEKNLEKLKTLKNSKNFRLSQELKQILN